MSEGPLLLSAREQNIIQAIMCETDGSAPVEQAQRYGWLESKEDGTYKDNCERKECEAKLTWLGLQIPW